MELLIPVLLIILTILLLAILFILLKKKDPVDTPQSLPQDNREVLQRLESLERNTAAALRDMRNEQNSLAHVARVENANANDRLSEQLDKRVARLADLTNTNLDRIRTTVDERLNVSLDQKFSQVSQRLAEVHKGLGQMQSMESSVDELKRILSNVKVRGTWGEMQLGNILKDILDSSRYIENAEIRPHSGLRVEYALRLPGQREQEVLLPIDAKFPLEDYQRLQQAREAGDATAQAAAIKQLERRLRSEAKDIHDKYIYPPYSTDFAVLYLPSEGLFVEALSIAGLAEGLQQQLRVCIAGPSTLAALVNSLQLGFRTLAVQQRTTEVWQLLNKVKQDLIGLQNALDKSGKKIDEAQSALQSTSRYVTRLSRELEQVQVLDDSDKEQMIQ